MVSMAAALSNIYIRPMLYAIHKQIVYEAIQHPPTPRNMSTTTMSQSRATEKDAHFSHFIRTTSTMARAVKMMVSPNTTAAAKRARDCRRKSDCV